MPNLRAFTMPKWGIEMTEGTVTEWAVQPGGSFVKGDVLAHIETDKINNEVTAEFNGVLCRQLATAGDTLPVGALIAVLSLEGAPAADEVEAFVQRFDGTDGSDETSSHAPAAAWVQPAPEAEAPSAAVPADHSAVLMSPAARIRVRALKLDPTTIRGTGRNGRLTLQDVVLASTRSAGPAHRPPVQSIAVPEFTTPVFASPRAARLMHENEIDARTLVPTGPRGRICKADVIARINPAGVATLQTDAATLPAVRRMSAARKAIALRLTQSKSQIPHFYLRMQVRLDALMDLREAARRAVGKPPSVNDYLIRAVALALMDAPSMNIQVHADEIHQFAHADIAVAVSTESGLMTPIVFAAENKSVAAISQEAARLAAAARDGKLRSEQVKGGSFTISNLGMYGIDEFDAIINPPQGAILAVGAVRRRPVEIQHALAFSSTAHLSLSCDHRAIDGALGAQFMARLRELLEEPSQLTK